MCSDIVYYGNMATTPQIQADCSFCRSNGILQGNVLAQSKGAYLIKASTSSSNYLIIPDPHIESLLDLPDNWWQEIKSLLLNVPNLQSYNVSINIGEQAGQTMKHLHFWVIPRLSGLPASGKGVARLIAETNQQG